MFPLGTLVFPHAALPLHVFEPRYVALVEQMLRGDIAPEFGIVLIERGREVGGGDVRFSVGTLVRVVRAARLPNDRYVLEAVGTGRVRVLEWLADDPFPRARVENLPDVVNEDAAAARDAAEFALRRVLALAAELGAAADAMVAIDDEPVRASFEIATAAPLGPLDAQQILEIDDVASRLRVLEGLLVEQRELLEARIAAADAAEPDG